MSATTVFGLACWAVLATEPGCLAAQGHWSSGAGKCHTRLCLLQGDCGEMASPAAACNKVRSATAVAACTSTWAIPCLVRAHEAEWPEGKADNGSIRARFEDERLVSLACPVTP